MLDLGEITCLEARTMPAGVLNVEVEAYLRAAKISVMSTDVY
jgi:hypothetical protein